MNKKLDIFGENGIKLFGKYIFTTLQERVFYENVNVENKTNQEDKIR